MRQFSIAMCLVVMAASTAAAGDYGTINLTGYNRGPVTGNGGQFNWLFDDTNTTLPAGWTLAPSIDFSADPDRLAAFCLEIGVGENAGNGTFHVNELVNSPLYATNSEMTPQQATEVNLLAVNYMLNVATNSQAGAFQLAVWDVLYGDGDYNVDTNPVGSTGISNAGVRTAANTLLASLPGAGGTLTPVAGLRALALALDGKQDMLVIVSVPEAASLLAFASVAGAIGLVMYRRRK